MIDPSFGVRLEKEACMSPQNAFLLADMGPHTADDGHVHVSLHC